MARMTDPFIAGFLAELEKDAGLGDILRKSYQNSRKGVLGLVAGIGIGSAGTGHLMQEPFERGLADMISQGEHHAAMRSAAYKRTGSIPSMAEDLAPKPYRLTADKPVPLTPGTFVLDQALVTPARIRGYEEAKARAAAKLKKK